MFPDFFCGEDRNSDIEDLNNLVFAVRSLYESNNEADMCDTLLNEFCLSMSEKTNQFESINFHLLRHLGWQAKNIGPLFASSASMFESANHRVICPLTGTVNHCQLLVTRYLRNKLIEKLKVENDCLATFVHSDKKKFDETFSMKETEASRSFASVNPNCQIFGRLHKKFYFTSSVYSKARKADQFVAIKLDEIVIGELQFFYENDSGRAICLKVYKILRRLRLLKERGSQSNTIFGYIAEETEKLIHVPLSTIACKLFPIEFQETLYFVTMLQHFEHD